MSNRTLRFSFMSSLLFVIVGCGAGKPPEQVVLERMVGTWMYHYDAYTPGGRGITRVAASQDPETLQTKVIWDFLMGDPCRLFTTLTVLEAPSSELFTWSVLAHRTACGFEKGYNGVYRNFYPQAASENYGEVWLTAEAGADVTNKDAPQVLEAYKCSDDPEADVSSVPLCEGLNGIQPIEWDPPAE